MRISRYRQTCPMPSHAEPPKDCPGRVIAERHGMAVQSFKVAADGFLRDTGPADFDDANVWLEFYCSEGHSLDPDDLRPADEDGDLLARAIEAGDAAVREAAAHDDDGGTDEGPTCYVCDGVLPAGARYCPPPCGAGHQNPREADGEADRD